MKKFISELFFLTAENNFFDSKPDTIDELYEKYSKESKKRIDEVIASFYKITDFLNGLNIDYDALKKLNWTTHLYGLFSFAWYCVGSEISVEKVRTPLIQLYTEYFAKTSNEYSASLRKYKESCSSRTRSDAQRKNRLNAIIEYCEL